MTWFPPITYVGALFIGAAIGLLTGMFGVGGGFLVTPLLNVLLGIPMHYAVGTGLLQVLGTTSSGIYLRRKMGLIDLKLAVTLFGGSTVGVLLGTEALTNLKEAGVVTLRGHIVSAADLYTLIIYVVMLVAIAAYMLYDTSRKTPLAEDRDSPFAQIRIPPYARFDSLNGLRLSIPALSYFGLLLGYLTGLLGVGGGVILLPALVYLVGMRTHCAAATSLVMVWFSAAIAVWGHTLAGNARLDLAVPLLVGGTLGVQVGVVIADRTRASRLRRYFAWVVVLSAFVVAGKLLGMLW
jgi:hypothetical protein